MYSMTGYGRATVERDGRQLTIEMKSVNHRFLDLSFRMPRSFNFVEEDMRRLISKTLNRGHVDLYVTYKNLREDARRVDLDRAMFLAYRRALDEMVGLDPIHDDRSVMGMAKLNDVLVITEAEEDQEALKLLVNDTLIQALDGLTAMRAREGESMRAVLSGHTDKIEEIVAEIEARYPETIKNYTERLKARVEELLGSDIDEQRLMQEVAVMADRSAIDEETNRLKSHIAQMRELLSEKNPVGRKLDFIVQELNREVNTISSKSQDIPITRLAVDAKAEIEKLREQVQNVE